MCTDSLCSDFRSTLNVFFSGHKFPAATKDKVFDDKENTSLVEIDVRSVQSYVSLSNDVVIYRMYPEYKKKSA